MSDIGPLAAALAKAQTAFPTVTRDKEVRVTSERTGKSYSFKYAPLDSILNAVRGPLAENGLVVVQLLDDGALVTSLIHDSGALLTGRLDLPGISDIQAFGSAITYLRRYAIQAMLGIAAEDDDDGNHAAGNTITPARIPTVPQTDDGGLIGVAEVGTARDSDFELRESPDGWTLGFRLKANGRGGIKVLARDAIALGLASAKAEIVGQRVTCWGHISDETFTPKGSKRKVTYQVLQLERISGPDLAFPATDANPDGVTPLRPEAESVPVWEPLDEDEKAAIAGSLPPSADDLPGVLVANEASDAGSRR